MVRDGFRNHPQYFQSIVPPPAPCKGQSMMRVHAQAGEEGVGGGLVGVDLVAPKRSFCLVCNLLIQTAHFEPLAKATSTAGHEPSSLLDKAQQEPWSLHTRHFSPAGCKHFLKFDSCGCAAQCFTTSQPQFASTKIRRKGGAARPLVSLAHCQPRTAMQSGSAYLLVG